MAERRPLVLIDGEVKELPTDDTAITGESEEQQVAGFLPPADRIDDTTGIEFFHFGWEDVNGGWLIRRQTRSDSTFVDATESNNSSYTTLAEAWPFRLGLTYE